ncbi:MAG: hypothetical protein HY843_00885 [Bdellovibrio sp.]|nr:hypothetical protein [Bdellovibrio sp.]
MEIAWDVVKKFSPFSSTNDLISNNGCFLPIIYEDENIFSLHKFSGIPSEPLKKETETALGAALAHVKTVFPLHRLDTATSGLLLYAKSKLEFERLRKAWKNQQVRKIYRALVKFNGRSSYGVDKYNLLDHLRLPYEINFPIGHSIKSKKKMIVKVATSKKNSIRGRWYPAKTIILGVKQLSPECFDLEIEIKTGVMHQIRCHLCNLGFSVIGDTVYRGEQNLAFGLHAWKLNIPLRDGIDLALISQLPAWWGTLK